MFALGLAAGAAEKGQENFSRIREKAARQIEEARVFAEKAKARETQANEVRSKIGNASKSYGIKENLLLSAYKDGNLDMYLKGVEEARERAAVTGQQLSPEILESYYSVPRSMYEGRDVGEELNKIFGVIQTGVNNQEQIDDASLADIIMSALGGDDEGAVRRRNQRETVQGYDLDTLMNMPSVGPVEGDGGSFSDDFYQDVNRKTTADKPDSGAGYTEKQNFDRLLAEGMGAITQMGGATVGEAAKAGIEAELSKALSDYVIEQMDAGVKVPQLTPEIMRSVFRTDGEFAYIRAGADFEGNALWNKVNLQTGVQSEQLTDEQLNGTLGEEDVDMPSVEPDVEPEDDLTEEDPDTVRRIGDVKFVKDKNGIWVVEN